MRGERREEECEETEIRRKGWKGKKEREKTSEGWREELGS